jgi:hypothetical protein
MGHNGTNSKQQAILHETQSGTTPLQQTLLLSLPLKPSVSRSRSHIEWGADAPERRLLGFIQEQDVEVFMPAKNVCKYRTDLAYQVGVRTMVGLETECHA